MIRRWEEPSLASLVARVVRFASPDDDALFERLLRLDLRSSAVSVSGADGSATVQIAVSAFPHPCSSEDSDGDDVAYVVSVGPGQKRRRSDDWGVAETAVQPCTGPRTSLRR